MLYFLGWFYFLLLFKGYLGFRVVGRSNVPAKGAFIFASNHQSFLDPILLGASIYRSLNYMAKGELFRNPLCGWILKKVHSVPVKREEGDLRAIKNALKLLGSGRPLVMFPEGSRSKYGKLGRPKPGIAFIAAKARVPVIPAYIEGSYDAMPEGIKTLKRHPVTAYIGEPVYLDWAIFDKHGKDAYQHVSDEIMRRIAGLKDTYVNKVG